MMETRVVMVELIHEYTKKHQPGLRFEVWCKPQDDLQPNYVVASTFDPFTADLLGLSKQLHETVLMTVDTDERGLTDVVRVDAGPRVEDWHRNQDRLKRLKRHA